MTRLVAACLALLVAACTAGTGSPTAPTTGASPAATRNAGPTPALASPPGATASSVTQSPSATQPPASATQPPATATSAAGSPSVALGWSELTPSADAPGPREDQTWTVDPAGTSAYLFGGRKGRVSFDELWRYDLTTDSWTRLQPESTSPPARFGHVAAWAEGVGLVIWSGQAGSDFFNDAWAYDPARNAWTELPAGGEVPPARYGSCGAIGPDGRLWISHGFTGDRGRFNDTRAYDFAAGGWSDVTPPEPLPVVRCLHDCLWAPDGSLLLYGGQTTGVPAIGDLWAYSPSANAWSEAAEPPLPARQLYALATMGERAWIFGGGAMDGGVLDDLWLLDTALLTWSEAVTNGPRPEGRSGATLIADAERNRLLLFGGRGTTELADLWQLELGG